MSSQAPAYGRDVLGNRPWRACAARDNPFIAMSNMARLAIVMYFVIWRILPEVAAALQFASPAWDIVAARLFVRVALELLLLLPFLLYRYAGTPIGWLHPLILPGLLSIAKEVVTNPYTLLTAVTAWVSAPAIPEYRLMAGMPLEVLLSVELKRDALLVLAQIAYLLGFAAYSRQARPNVEERPVGLSQFRLMLVVGICFAVFLAFLQMNGGLVEHFSSLAWGRFRMSESAGHFLVIIKLLPYLMVLWYVAQPSVLRRPWFLALLAAAIIAQYVTTGSRSGLIAPVVMVIAAWMLINRKTPALRVALFGAAVAVSLGALGDLRSSALHNRGTADLSVLTDIDLAEGAERTSEHRAVLAEASGQIAIMYAVPDSVPHLYGSTYIAAIAFFIPRTIWPDKPRGPGAHVAAMIYMGMSSTVGYTGGGFPPGGVGEAYWNFGVPGVIVIHFLFGLALRLVARSYLQRPRSPLHTLVFLMTMLTLGDPNSDSIVSFLQAFVLVTLTWFFVRQAPARSAPARDIRMPADRLSRGAGGTRPHPRGREAAGVVWSVPGRHGRAPL